MKQKKHSLFVLLCVLLSTVMLGACANEAKGSSPVEGQNPPDKRLNVVATVFAPYDFARQIAGDNADITMLLPPGSESHSFEPTTQDILAIQNCDIFIYVGGESDAWVEAILSSQEIADSISSGRMKVLTLMDCVEAVEEEIVTGMQDDEGHDHGDEAAHEGETETAREDEAGAVHEGETETAHEEESHADTEAVYDEHVWTSPRNAKLIVQKISDVLCETDSGNVKVYQENTIAYLAKLDELDSQFQAVVDGAARKTFVFGDRFPFRYFADAYGLTYSAAFPGCSTETEPSAQTVAFLIDKVKAEKIPVIFHIEMGNEKMAETISEATGAKVLLLHACHNITDDDFKAGKTYQELMTANVEALKEALQ